MTTFLDDGSTINARVFHAFVRYAVAVRRCFMFPPPTTLFWPTPLSPSIPAPMHARPSSSWHRNITRVCHTNTCSSVFRSSYSYLWGIFILTRERRNNAFVKCVHNKCCRCCVLGSLVQYGQRDTSMSLTESAASHLLRSSEGSKDA